MSELLCNLGHQHNILRLNVNPDVLHSFFCIQVFNCYGKQFCLHFEAFQIGMAPVYMAFLRFMGEDSEARKYSYALEVGAYGRKLTWQGVPRSIRDSHKKVRDSQDGLIIPRALALFFSGGDGQELKLRVTGRIWKELWAYRWPDCTASWDSEYSVSRVASAGIMNIWLLFFVHWPFCY